MRSISGGLDAAREHLLSVGLSLGDTDTLNIVNIIQSFGSNYALCYNKLEEFLEGRCGVLSNQCEINELIRQVDAGLG